MSMRRSLAKFSMRVLEKAGLPQAASYGLVVHDVTKILLSLPAIESRLAEGPGT